MIHHHSGIFFVISLLSGQVEIVKSIIFCILKIILALFILKQKGFY